MTNIKSTKEIQIQNLNNDHLMIQPGFNEASQGTVFEPKGLSDNQKKQFNDLTNFNNPRKHSLFSNNAPIDSREGEIDLVALAEQKGLDFDFPIHDLPDDKFAEGAFGALADLTTIKKNGVS